MVTLEKSSCRHVDLVLAGMEVGSGDNGVETPPRVEEMSACRIAAVTCVGA